MSLKELIDEFNTRKADKVLSDRKFEAALIALKLELEKAVKEFVNGWNSQVNIIVCSDCSVAFSQLCNKDPLCFWEISENNTWIKNDMSMWDTVLQEVTSENGPISVEEVLTKMEKLQNLLPGIVVKTFKTPLTDPIAIKLLNGITNVHEGYEIVNGRYSMKEASDEY